ncbi:glycine betaine/L-proline ABC transporter substrate-binding protein ProX [Paenalcaligenes niemegkensis]|uniref:glycine betaine/L-proline ABC transporter substrate-binding protein ProX n=1 Tax=Paenalcaligenes niemegkensis TaxID=2895469 RepID=UPI001EE98458|nr:glycine betaine/L-proline ABC transporter substrate-binding protein ProX [Paenalcaligenes niemegkensis]MCQ9617670.1 glycine betaine/L-proline ABC transporter substrate-binding protein ProX [Paenalcaligenes niemegkensis]
MLKRICSKGNAGTVVALAASVVLSTAYAQALPGKGVTVIPVQSSQDVESFQTELVMEGLRELGYQVQPKAELEYATAHVAVANGDATFMAVHWKPQHNFFYENAGADAKLSRAGELSRYGLQGYLIDKATADKYGISNIGQLKDPEIAALFDTNGDGTADLTGCTPGWPCERVIEHHLDAYGLKGLVTHNQGSYEALMTEVFRRYEQGLPVLYYTWIPNYVSAALVPERDVIWLEVPFSSLPEEQGVDTAMPNGKNYGFTANTQHVVANKQFVEANPSAAKFFESVFIPGNDINAQNYRMHQGERSESDIGRHVQGWIQANQQKWDQWIADAKQAAK